MELLLMSEPWLFARWLHADVARPSDATIVQGEARMIHHHYRTARIRLRLLIVALFTLAGLASPLHAAASDPPLRCRESSLPVTLAPGATATYQVHGWLCARP